MTTSLFLGSRLFKRCERVFTAFLSVWLNPCVVCYESLLFLQRISMTVPACRVRMAEPAKMASTRSPVVVRLATADSIVKVRDITVCFVGLIEI